MEPGKKSSRQQPTGTIAFASVGVTSFGFDVFSVAVSQSPESTAADELAERRHTDGVSVNFNAQFTDEPGEDDEVAFVSERTGSAALFLCRPGRRATPLPAVEGSLFHDRPTLRRGRLYFVSAHEKPPGAPFRSWAALYVTDLARNETARVTPEGVADMSPAVSASGELVAVATYGGRPWAFEFRGALDTEVAVFRAGDPAARRVVVSTARGAGWPAWRGESAVFFHRVAEDNWWSVFRVDLDPGTLSPSPAGEARVTPPGVHCFTPAASGHNSRWIAVATRRKGHTHRQIELFDLETSRFAPITALLNPEIHHYNPFFSGSGARLGYHRFRGRHGAAATGESKIPYLAPVRSPVSSIRMLRVHGSFPSFSPDGKHLALNGDFFKSPGVTVVKSDGSRRWVVADRPDLFYISWSPTEPGVVFTSMGPIFESPKATVRIARLEFDPAQLLLPPAGNGDKVDVAALKALTRAESGNDAFPAASPCGRWVVFRSGRSGHKNLYILDAARGEPPPETEKTTAAPIRRLTEGEWTDTMPSWAPDGGLVAFSSNRHDPGNAAVFSVYLVRPDGTGLRRVHVAGPPGSPEADRERINHVCFSPDGEWLLFTANLGGVNAEPVSGPNQFQPYGDLYVCRLDGSGLTRLTCNAYENGTPAWGPVMEIDGAELALVDRAAEDSLGEFDEPLWLTCDV